MSSGQPAGKGQAKPPGPAKPPAPAKQPSQAKQPAQPPPSFAKLYWMRIGTGVLAGVLAFVFFSQTPVNFDDTSNGILLGVIVYLLTYYAARYVWFRRVSTEYFSKLYTTGIGGYIMLFIFTWILLFTAFSGSI
jgi:hypothetical protein